MLWEAGILEAAEYPIVNKKKRIAGRADGIVKFQGKRHLLEIKTINSFQFPKVKYAPLSNHEYQASLYASEAGIDSVIYLYICKDTSEISVHVKPPKKSHVKNANEKIAELNLDIKNGHTPTRECQTITHCFKSRERK